MIKTLLEILKQQPRSHVVKNGFHHAMSYRGYYAELGVEPCANVSVQDMIATLEGAIDSTYTGYKGGEYTMHDCSDVYLANYGDCGEELGPALLGYMLKDLTLSKACQICNEVVEPNNAAIWGADGTVTCCSCEGKKKSRKQLILDTLTDSISDLMYYRRKEDDALPVGSIEEAIEKGEITVDEMVEVFSATLRKCF